MSDEQNKEETANRSYVDELRNSGINLGSIGESRYTPSNGNDNGYVDYASYITPQADYQQPQAVEPVDQEAFWGSEERVTNTPWDPSTIMRLDNQANWIVDNTTNGAGHYENSDLITANIDHKQLHDTAQYLSAATQGRYSWDDDYWKNHNWRTDNEMWINYVSKWDVPADYVAQTETNAVQAEQVQSPTTTPQVDNQVADTGVVTPQTTTTTPTVSNTDVGTYKIDGGNIYYGSTDELYSEMQNNLLNSNPNDDYKAMFNVDTTGADYGSLNPYGKISYLTASGQSGSNAENAPDAAEWTQGIRQAFASSGAVGELVENGIQLAGGGKMLGEGAGKLASLAVAGLLYFANKGDIELPDGVGQALELLDLPNQLFTQLYGKTALALKDVTGTNLSNPNEWMNSIIDLITHPISVAKAYGNLSSTYGVDEDILNMMSKYASSTMVAIGGGLISNVDQAVTGALLGSNEALERGEVTRYNLGLSGKHKLKDGTYGEEGFIKWTQAAQELKNMGYSLEQIEAFISQKMYEYYGDYSELHNYNEDETMDPTNYTNGVHARALQGVGKVTGDVNLQTAAKANTGDVYSDVLHNFLPSNMQRVVQQALTTVSKGTIHESGGINDIKDVYDMENVYGDLDKVTPFGKRFSGIQEDGTLKGTFTPNQNETVSQRMKSFFSETNESKMYSEADTIINVLNTALDDALRARGNEDPASTAQRFEQLVTELTDPDAIGENSPLAGIKNTAIYQTIKSDIASGIGKNADTLRGYVAQFKNTANNRTMLNNVAEALGMSAAEVITQFNEKPDVIKKTIADAVTKNGGTLGKIAMPDVLTADDFANKVQQTLQPFVGKDGIAWDARLLGVQMSTKMFDGVQDALMEKYDVQSKSGIYRFGDTIRALQSLILLGLSPTYVANNLTNNIATRYTLGYGGFLTQKVIDDWNDRWGFKSARHEVAEGEYGYMGDSKSPRGRMHQKVEDKTMVKGTLNTIRTRAEKLNKQFGVFSKLSNVIENKESEQIMNMACRTYMARTWKEGVNYRKMDPYLENLMGEDMTKAVYAAINSSVNQAEIEDAIFGTYMKPSIHEAIADAARQAGIDNPEEYVNEVFVKTGLEEKLRSKLSGLQGENEIKTAVDEIRDYARNFAEYKYRSDLINKAEAVENIVTGEGVSAVYDQMINAQNEFHKLTENWRETMYRLYAMHKEMTNDAWSKEYTKARTEYDVRYQQLYDMNTQALLGIVNGLGLTDDSRKKYKSILVDAMQKKQNAYMRMYSQQKKAWDVYKAELDGFAKAGFTGSTLEVNQRAAWRKYNSTMDTINQKVVDIETKQNQRFNTALEQGFKASVSKRLHTQIDQYVMTPLKQADEIRARISEIEYQLRIESRKKEIETEGTESRMWDARNEVYNEYKAELQQLRAQENKLRTDAYKAMKEISQKSPDIEADEAAAYNQEDYDIAARIAVLQQEAEQVKKENAEYVKQVESDIDGNGEYAFGDSTWFSGAVDDRLTTRNLRKIATKAGATEKQAQKYAVFMTTLKKTYEEKHKGENFWEKIKLRVDFVPEVGQTNENGETLRAMFDYKAGENIVTIFKNGDLSSLIHETMHAVTSILDEDQRADLASWNGISAEHFDELQSKYLNGEALTADEQKEWSNIQEKFAYGFEEYLRSDKAPTVGIRKIFATVKTFFINLYENLKGFIGGVDPNEERNGVRLADIFESLITVEKEQKQEETVTEPAPQQMTIDDAPKVEPVEQVVTPETTTEQPVVEQSVEQPKVKREPDTNGAIYGNDAPVAYGNKNIHKIYEFVYKIIDLDKLVPSHIITGNTVQGNPAYTFSQPRLDRGTTSQLQDVVGKAIDMQPHKVIDEYKMIGHGTPIVTDTNMVADGNGRAMMMKYARDNKLPSWRKYQDYLRNVANDYGFDAEEIDNFKNPVLVRELKTEVDANDFAQDANTATAMRYSAYETAMQDAKKLNVKALWGVNQVGRDVDTPVFLRTTNANGVIKSFMEANPGDRASYMDGNGVLNEDGVDRITKALFASIFGEDAKDMVRVVSMMSNTSGVKRIIDGLADTIPQIGNVRARVLEGYVGKDWDVASTLGAGERAVYLARKSNTEITDYITQGSFDGPLPNKVRATAYFLSSVSKSEGVVKDFAREYAEQTVKNAPNQKQRDIFGNLPTEPTPEQILEDTFNSVIETTKKDYAKDAAREAINILHGDIQSSSLFQYDYTNRTVKPSEIDPAKIQARKVQPNYKLVEQMMDVAEKYNMRMLGASIISAYVEGKDVGKLEGDLKTLANLAEVTDELEMIWSVQNGENNISQTGYSVKPIVEQQINGQTIKAKIYHDGELVALIPNELPVTEVTIDDDVKCKVVGIDPNNPEAVVIATPNETLITIDPSAGRENKMKSEAFRPEMDVDSMPTIDPEGEATAEINFEQIIPILERLSGIYAGKIDSAMTSNKYGNLTPEGQRLLREYIDYVVRQDLASTKFKATKFSEMMRDAALLNYDKRYGFDNFLTFLSPYQFWQTRSAANWLRRLNDRKHLFNRYFRLKEMETKREKDFLPSRVEGMYGLPIYGLPDWMGSRVFFNTQQEVPIAGFLDPILESAEESSVLEASAKEILGQWVDAGTITSEQYTIAVNDHNNEKWKEAMAQAEIENPRTHDTASVLQDYLGLPLPASWIKAGIENDPSALSQLPSTKLGNALGATFTSSRTDSLGKLINGVGDTAQFIASLPERGMHAVMKGVFGDEFEYKDFGSYGDYYIDQQLFYMVMEGMITTDQMLLAMEQRDGNEVYEKAYDRAREQIAMKTPGYASVASLKNLYADGKKLAQGDESVSWKDVGNDLVGTLEAFALSPKGLYIVPEGESKMREGMAEQTKAYENGTQNQFFKDNPEMSYKNLQYMTDDPEGRYRTWCYKNLTNIYFSMNETEKQTVNEQLDDFYDAIINPETRCYETVDLKKLTGWTQALMGETPYMNNSDYGQEAEKYNYTPPTQQTINEVQQFYTEKDEKFPGISRVEDMYYSMPVNQRKDFLAYFPELNNYWSWKGQYRDTHPEYDAWAGRRTDYYKQQQADEAFALMDSLTLKAFARNSVTSDYYPAIRRIQEQLGNTDSIEDFVQELQDYYIE